MKTMIPSLALIFTLNLFGQGLSLAQTEEAPIHKTVIRNCLRPGTTAQPIPYGKSSYKYKESSSTTSGAMPKQRVGSFETTRTVPGTASLQDPPAPAPISDNNNTLQSNLLQEGQLDLHQSGKKVDKNIAKAKQLYLSNDDSMSLASAQRMIYAIENFLPLYRNEIRPHEFLNYFHFKTLPVSPGKTFSVNFQMAPGDSGESLAMAVQGKQLDNAERRPAVLTLLLDKSGSMGAQGKIEFLKKGLEILKSQLKAGDLINVVEFDNEICVAIEGLPWGKNAIPDYDKTVNQLSPRGSTNLHDGLLTAYQLAERFYDPQKINRVLLVTDAIANTGQLSPDLMASIGKYYDTRQIALSGIGLGLDFNDELLDTLTDRGKGAYLFVGLESALPRVFGEDFLSLLETTARNVHFQVTLPEGLHLETFYGEEVDTEKSQVQAIHYFANSSQLFFLDLKGKAKTDTLQLNVEFQDPNNEQNRNENFQASVSELTRYGRENISKARLIMVFADLLEKTALPGNRPYGNWAPLTKSPTPSAKNLNEEKKLCSTTLEEMQKLSREYLDTEVRYVQELAQKYCSRF